jgi:hypothetical protein
VISKTSTRWLNIEKDVSWLTESKEGGQHSHWKGTAQPGEETARNGLSGCYILSCFFSFLLALSFSLHKFPFST